MFEVHGLKIVYSSRKFYLKDDLLSSIIIMNVSFLYNYYLTYPYFACLKLNYYHIQIFFVYSFEFYIFLKYFLK